MIEGKIFCEYASCKKNGNLAILHEQPMKNVFIFVYLNLDADPDEHAFIVAVEGRGIDPPDLYNERYATMYQANAAFERVYRIVKGAE